VPTVLSFEKLCRSFCALEDLPIPSLATGREGLEAFTLDVDDVSLTVLHDEDVDPGTLFLVAELGPPASAEAELETWLALLDANYWLRSESAPTFSRNPQTGEAVFQWTLPFTQSSAHSLHESVVTMGNLARRWNPAKPVEIPPPQRELAFGTFA
jgi:hypothetical protein